MTQLFISPGHINIQYNCDTSMRGLTGAPGEQEKNLRIVSRLCEILRTKGFGVTQGDANDNCNPAVTGKDWNLYLACHCDSNYAGDEGGGFIDYPDPSVDSSNAESKRIKEAMESEYFDHSGIRNVPTRSNPNTKFYYMWRTLSDKTPCVIVEMGESVDPHDSVILADTERVASSLARGICKAFNVQFDTPVVTPPTPPVVPPVTPPVVTPPVVPIVDYKPQMVKIKEAVFGKGWSWQKVNKVREIITQANI